MTHDSGLGEDGPTHQPVEMLESLRAMPNMYVFRPCDGNEVAGPTRCGQELWRTIGAGIVAPGYGGNTVPRQLLWRRERTCSRAQRVLKL